MNASSRPFDVVVLGATGFTGALTAQEVAARIPEGARWAIAGRNRGKLEAVGARLAEQHRAAEDLPIVQADVTDPASMRELAEQTHVVASTVGPYISYGEPLVAACAEAGTDYVDLSGEPEFVDRMWLDHHERAVETGARLVHSCGFDSVPHDLGVHFCVRHLPEGVPLHVRGYVRAGGRPSGGTFHSAITAFSRIRQAASVHAKRRKREGGGDETRRVRAVSGAPHRAFGHWAVPLPTIDPQIVVGSARALERYGPDFSYSHYAAVKRLPIAVGGVAGTAALFGLAQLPPARRALLSRLSPGDGPTPEQRAKGWFSVRVVGEGDGQRTICEVRGGDPGYGETSKMLAESALCLAFDDLPVTAGQVTTAAAMGDALTDRLQRAGITFTLLEQGAK